MLLSPIDLAAREIPCLQVLVGAVLCEESCPPRRVSRVPGTGVLPFHAQDREIVGYVLPLRHDWRSATQPRSPIDLSYSQSKMRRRS